MNFIYENQGANTYLVYKIKQEDMIDTMALGMLTNNKITGLAPMLFTQMNADKYLKYNVTSKVSLQSFFSGTVNKKRILGVLNGITDALLNASDYMISEQSVLLDMNYIFTDVSTCETILICLPTIESLNQMDIGTFIKNIMFTTQFDQTENCDYVARIFNFINSSVTFQIYEFKKLLESLIEPAQIQPTQIVQQVLESPKKAVQPVVTKPQYVETPPTKIQTDAKEYKSQVQPTSEPVQQTGKEEIQMSFMKLMMHYSKENKELYKAQKAARKEAKKDGNKSKTKKQETPTNVSFAIPGQQTTIPKPQENHKSVENKQVSQALKSETTPPKSTPLQTQNIIPIQNGHFGETTVLGSNKVGETTVLNSQVWQKVDLIAPHLIRVATNEKISINKPLFHIGKEKGYVDYCVLNNPAVSRSHADIITENTEYYIVDMNSTNHTYVNDVIIQSNVKTKLNDGDKVRLANEDFVFHLHNK